MRYDRKSGTLKIACREFVALARRGVSESVPVEDDEPTVAREDAYLRRHFLSCETPPEKISYTFSLGEYTVEIQAFADIIEQNTLTLLCLTDRSTKHPPREWVSQMRGEGYIAAYAYAMIQSLPMVTLRFCYANPERDEKNEIEEHLSKKRLASFFQKCKNAMAVFAAPSIERVTKRLPTMKNARFPYGKMREGQDEFVHAVYRSISRGVNLYAEAPTGIGKTVSAIYPAVRAMGDEKCDKIFYLTPKTTTANAALECIHDLCQNGVSIRSVKLTAKDKICPHGTICRQSRERCDLLKSNRLAEAALALYRTENPTVTGEDVRAIAEEYRICPYELSLTYSELCDLVICDINYLFDDNVYLRRFFDHAGEYAFLIDEAHNLPDRAREMFSAELSEDDLDFNTSDLSDHSQLRHTINEIKPDFCKLLFAYIKNELREDKNGEKIGVAHGSRLPDHLHTMIGKLIESAEHELFAAFREKTEDKARALREYYYCLTTFMRVLTRFDEHYEYFIRLENGKLTIKLFCIDPGSILKEKCAVGRSAVYFSATLSPIGYYKAMLGGSGFDETLSVTSPFDPSQLSVSIMDKISTRSSERERTLGAVLRVIAATVSAKRGNYMIFSPSFEYNEMLAAAFRAKYPKIRTIEQTRGMNEEQREHFINEFSHEGENYLVAFSVTGGIYSEGIDLFGDKLIGAVVVGVTLPQLSLEREAMAAYFEEKYEAGKQYAYVYPGFNKVLQAAGRVIRREGDRGVIVLIDDRFRDPVYKKGIPDLWHGLKFVGDPKSLNALLKRFWETEN